MRVEIVSLSHRLIVSWTLLIVATITPVAAQTTTARPDPLVMRTKGSPTAPVTVYEMSDFQCPFCKRQVDETWPILQKEYITTGKVRWIFINYPLVAIHPNAVPAAELAMCAGRAGKFWEAHDLVFRHQKVWGPLKDPGPFLASLLDTLKLRRPQVLQCLEKGEARAEIQGDVEGSIRAGAQSTPTFYIEGGIMAGAQPVELFRQILDSIYRARTTK